MCVCERERDKERERETDRERDKETETNVSPVNCWRPGRNNTDVINTLSGE